MPEADRAPSSADRDTQGAGADCRIPPEEVRKQLKDDQVDPVAQLVLRGKVAYLFERYTDDQEMNVLILCAPSHKQSDVKDLGPVLETWVNSTQGADPAVRARRVGLPGPAAGYPSRPARVVPAAGAFRHAARAAKLHTSGEK